MRISDTMNRQLIGEQMSRTSDQISQLQTQISSGVRFQQPSEDPESAVRVASLNTSLAQVTQYQKNATAATSWLTTEESTLGNIGDLVSQAHTLAVQGANDTATDQRTALATQIDALRSSILAAGNTKLGDQYLFGGYQTNTAPLTDSAAGVQNHGDIGVISMAVSDQSNITLNTSSAQIFNFGGAADATTPDLFTTLSNLSTALRNNDQTGIQMAMGELQTHDTHIESLRGNTGIRMQEAQLASDQLTKSNDTLTGLISDTQGTDITQALVSLQTEQNVLQAASYIASNLSQHGLLYWLK